MINNKIKVLAAMLLIAGSSTSFASPSCEITSQSVITPSQGVKVGENGFLYADVEHSCPSGYNVYIESPAISITSNNVDGLKYKFELNVHDENALLGESYINSKRCEYDGIFGNRSDGGCWFYRAGSSNSETIIKTRFMIKYESTGQSPEKTVTARDVFRFKYSLLPI